MLSIGGFGPKHKKEKNHGRLDKDSEEFKNMLRSIHGGA